MSVAPDAMALGRLASFHHRFPVLAVARLARTPPGDVTQALHRLLLEVIRGWAGPALGPHVSLRERTAGVFDPVFDLSSLPLERPWSLASGPRLEVYEESPGSRCLLQNLGPIGPGREDLLCLADARILDPFLPPREDFSLVVAQSGEPICPLFQRLPHRLWFAHLKRRMAFFQLSELCRLTTCRMLNTLLPWGPLPSDSLAACLDRGLGTMISGPVSWNDTSITIESSFLERAYVVGARGSQSFRIREHPLEGIDEASQPYEEDADAIPLMMVEYGCVLRLETEGVARWVWVGGQGRWDDMQWQLLRSCGPLQEGAPQLREGLVRIAQAVVEQGASAEVCWAHLRAALAPAATLGDGLPVLRPPTVARGEPSENEPAHQVEIVDKACGPIHALLSSNATTELAIVEHRALRVWDLATGSLLRRYRLLRRGELDWLTCGARSGDARWMATVSASGCVHWIGDAGVGTMELHATTERQSTRMALSHRGELGAVLAQNRSAFLDLQVHHEVLVFDHREVLHRHAWATHLGQPRGLWFAMGVAGEAEAVVLLLGPHLIAWDLAKGTAAQIRDDVLSYDPISHRVWVLGDALADPSTSAVCDDLRETRVVALQPGSWEEAAAGGQPLVFDESATAPIRVTKDDVCLLRAEPPEVLFKSRFGPKPAEVLVASYGGRPQQAGRRFELPWDAEARLAPLGDLMPGADQILDLWTGREVLGLRRSEPSFGIERLAGDPGRALLWHATRGAELVDFAGEVSRTALRGSADRRASEWTVSADGRVARQLDLFGEVRQWSTATGEPLDADAADAPAIDANMDYLVTIDAGLLTVHSRASGELLARHEHAASLPWEGDHPTLRAKIHSDWSPEAARFSGSGRFLLIRSEQVPCTLSAMDWRSGELAWQVLIDSLDWERFEFSIHGPPRIERFEVSDDGQTLSLSSQTRLWTWEWSGSQLVLQRIYVAGDGLNWGLWDVDRGVVLSEQMHESVEILQRS